MEGVRGVGERRRDVAAGLGLVEVGMQDELRSAPRREADRLGIAPTFVADGDAERQRTGLEHASPRARRVRAVFGGIHLRLVLKSDDRSVPIEDDRRDPQVAVDHALGADDRDEPGLCARRCEAGPCSFEKSRIRRQHDMRADPVSRYEALGKGDQAGAGRGGRGDGAFGESDRLFSGGRKSEVGQGDAESAHGSVEVIGHIHDAVERTLPFSCTILPAVGGTPATVDGFPEGWPLIADELVYDWNDGGWSARAVELNDESLRDGLQSPSVVDPAIEVKCQLVDAMSDAGIEALNIGFPASSERALSDAVALGRHVARAGSRMSCNAAARTKVEDIAAVARVSQACGIRIEVGAFVGASPLRQRAEGRTLDELWIRAEEAIAFARRENLPVMLVMEDTTRSPPDLVRSLYLRAIRSGATRLCLADTVGHATPGGVRRLVEFVRKEVIGGADIKLDWHGHRDRGLGVANALAAIEAGVDRVHATALGIGERVGNTELDLLVVNLHELGARRVDLRRLRAYVELAACAFGVPIPSGYPVFGADAFRTGSGVHAAAMEKALDKGRGVRDKLYSSVSAGELGLEQRVEVSYLSGRANVRAWLEAHGFDDTDEELCAALLDHAKKSRGLLAEDELREVVAGRRAARRRPRE